MKVLYLLLVSAVMAVLQSGTACAGDAIGAFENSTPYQGNAAGKVQVDISWDHADTMGEVEMALYKVENGSYTILLTRSVNNPPEAGTRSWTIEGLTTGITVVGVITIYDSMGMSLFETPYSNACVVP